MTVSSLEVPRVLGPYVLVRHLGSGGMADVYLAKQRQGLGVERLVALKTIRQSATAEEAARLQPLFEREARVAAAQCHHNIVQVFDAGRIDDTLYLVMEFIQGRSLAQILSRASLPLAAALHIGREMLGGLAYLHGQRALDGQAQGLIHRDVSPQNVLVSYAGSVKLSDFGLAKATERTEGDESTSGPKGKAAYMSPEQAYGLHLDARSDLFSAGIVLFEMCTGQRLYGGKDKNPLQVLTAARRARIPEPREVNPSLPAPLSAALLRALEKNPADRFATTEAMGAALQAVAAAFPFSSQELAGMLRERFAREMAEEREQLIRDNASAEICLSTSDGLSPASRPRPRPRPRTWLVLGLAVTLLLLSAGIIFIALRPRAPGREPGIAALSKTAPRRVLDAAPAGLAPDAGVPPRATSESSSMDAGPHQTRPSGWGHLNVGAKPWARVYLDGRYLGDTPVVDVRVRAGRHMLQLVCAATGKSRRVPIDVGNNKRVQRVFDLQ